LVPAQRLTKGEAIEQLLDLTHGKLPPSPHRC
jgi:hypothetical protein